MKPRVMLKVLLLCGVTVAFCMFTQDPETANDGDRVIEHDASALPHRPTGIAERELPSPSVTTSLETPYRVSIAADGSWSPPPPPTFLGDSATVSFPIARPCLNRRTLEMFLPATAPSRDP